jgi:hypothetical protein
MEDGAEVFGLPREHCQHVGVEDEVAPCPRKRFDIRAGCVRDAGGGADDDGGRFFGLGDEVFSAGKAGGHHCLD